MDTWKIIIVAASVSAAVTMLILLAIKSKGNNMQNDELILKRCFGDPVLSGQFSFQNAKEWFLHRKDKISSGHKGIILKATSENLKSLGTECRINFNADNYLILAIVNMQDHDITDSVLIKYNSIDDQLERNLESGNGVLVIGGE